MTHPHTPETLNRIEAAINEAGAACPNCGTPATFESGPFTMTDFRAG